MKRRWSLLASAVAIGLLFPAAVRAGHGFAPGHIFLSVLESDPCEFGGLEVIVEVDPVTGDASVFADSDDGICNVSGLRFTPDKRSLLALSAGRVLAPLNLGSVQAFNSDGIGTVILDETDGIVRPFGANALAFDASGNLYVLNAGNSTILRFPTDGGPATVFADAADGINDRGALDFAPNGDLFYCGDLAHVIIRITSDGESSVFDTLPAPSSLAFDPQGNLFVGAGQAGVGATIYRYDNGDPNTRRILSQGFDGFLGTALPIVLSADGRVLYFLELHGTLYAIDAEDGTTTVVTDLRDLLSEVMDIIAPAGIAVSATEAIPAVSEWGLGLLALLVVTVGSVILIRRPVLFHGGVFEKHG